MTDKNAGNSIIMKQINDLNNQIENCCKCELYKTRNKVVPGEGNLTAKIMIIGEGPGAENDKTGRPFVGRGGTILDNIFISVGLNRSDLFLTNIIKCRMPHNAIPSNSAVKNCIGYLNSQISIINPKVIITLGLSAAKVMLSNSRLKLSDVKGKKIGIDGRFIICTYHPSSIRYNKNAKEDIINALLTAKELVDL